jgi:hypothetical protein
VSRAIGFSVDVPDTWQDSSQYYGYQFSYSDPAHQGFVTAGVRPSLGQPGSLDAVADQWIAQLQNPQVRVTPQGGVVDLRSRKHVRIDGKPAVELQLSVRGVPTPTDDTSYIVRTSAGMAMQLTVGGPSPHPDQALLDWVVSTIRIS